MTSGAGSWLAISVLAATFGLWMSVRDPDRAISVGRWGRTVAEGWVFETNADVRYAYLLLLLVVVAALLSWGAGLLGRPSWASVAIVLVPGSVAVLSGGALLERLVTVGPALVVLGLLVFGGTRSRWVASGASVVLAAWWAAYAVVRPARGRSLVVADLHYLTAVDAHHALSTAIGLRTPPPDVVIDPGPYGGLSGTVRAIGAAIHSLTGARASPVDAVVVGHLAFLLLVVLAFVVAVGVSAPPFIALAVVVVPAAALSLQGPGLHFPNHSGLRYLGLATILLGHASAVRWPGRATLALGLGCGAAVTGSVDVLAVGIVSLLVHSTLLARGGGAGGVAVVRAAAASSAVAFGSGGTLSWLADGGRGILSGLEWVLRFASGFGGRVAPLSPVAGVMIPLLLGLLVAAVRSEPEQRSRSSAVIALAVLGLGLATKFINRNDDWDAWPVVLVLCLALAVFVGPGPGSSGAVGALGGANGSRFAFAGISMAMLAAAPIGGLAAGLGVEEERVVACRPPSVELEWYCLAPAVEEEVDAALELLTDTVRRPDRTLVLSTVPALLSAAGYNERSPTTSVTESLVDGSRSEELAEAIGRSGIRTIVVTADDSTLADRNGATLALFDEFIAGLGPSREVYRDRHWRHLAIPGPP